MKTIRKLILSIMIISSFSVLMPAKALAAADLTTVSAAGYKDISGKWFEKWADSYGYKEIFSNGDNCFYPDQPITRMEFARMLHKALGINMNYFAATDISEYFSDVKSGEKGANELYDLVTCGIIDVKGSFYPNAKLDRETLIHFTMNAFYYTVRNDCATADAEIKPFADDSEIGAAYKSDLYHAAYLDIVCGRGSNMVKPLEKATRAEAVTITGRLIELINKTKTSVNVKASASAENGELTLRLSILNNTNKAITIEHGYGQIFDFEIEDINGNRLYKWSEGRMFPMMLTTTKIAPGEESVFSDKVDAKTYAAIKDKIAVVKAYIVGTSPDFPISKNGYIISKIT